MAASGLSAARSFFSSPHGTHTAANLKQSRPLDRRYSAPVSGLWAREMGVRQRTETVRHTQHDAHGRARHTLEYSERRQSDGLCHGHRFATRGATLYLPGSTTLGSIGPTQSRACKRLLRVCVVRLVQERDFHVLVSRHQQQRHHALERDHLVLRSEQRVWQSGRVRQTQ